MPRTVPGEKPVNRFTPGLFSVAAQVKGIPLVSEPKANTRTRPLPETETTAGSCASRILRPAPAVFRPACFNIYNVSTRPGYPQSSTWLFANPQQSIFAAVMHGILLGLIR